jgi:ATP/maltotriose-dependent transcriptional regulator MalT
MEHRMASPVPENDGQLPFTGRVDIARPRLVRALEGHGSYSLTIVNAPIGSGTTTLLRQFAASREGVRYVDARGMQEPQLRAALLSGDSLEAVILDHLDLAAPDAVAALMRDVASDCGLGRRVIIGAHARRSVQAQDLVARGIAATIDAHDLAFLPEEVEALATALGVEHSAEDIAELLHVTEGWALALSWILRNAADEGRPMRGAFDLWSKRRGHLLIEFLEETDALASAARGRFSAL